MPSKPETTFTNRVHRALPPVKFFHREKMHNHYRGGTADYWYSGNGSDLWVEYKYIPALPVRNDTLIHADLSELQRDWINGRYAEGRNVWVVIGHPKGAVVLNNLRWNEPLSTAKFKEQSISAQDFAQLLLTFCQGKTNVNTDLHPRGARTLAI